MDKPQLNPDIVYQDLSARLGKDDNQAMQIITICGLMLTLLFALVGSSSTIAWPTIAAALLAGLCLTASMFFAWVALLNHGDMRKLQRPLWAIAIDQELVKRNQTILTSPNGSGLFHTRDIIEARGTSREARLEYRNNLLASLELDYADYVFFLAFLIEMKKKPRKMALVCLMSGIVLLFLALLVRLVALKM